MKHTPCPTAPEHIWLQVDPEPEEDGKPVYPENPSQDDVTWCWDRINEHDTLYVRGDIAERHLQDKRTLLLVIANILTEEQLAAPISSLGGLSARQIYSDVVSTRGTIS